MDQTVSGGKRAFAGDRLRKARCPEMNILCLGDVVGQAGCDCVRSKLPGLKAQYQVDLVVANGENSAEGNGVLPHSARHLFDSGVDVITTGNHALRRRESYDLFDQEIGLIRPANFHPSAPGSGVYLFDHPRFSLCVINLQGVVYLDNLESPFDCVDRLLQRVQAPNILVDFHAEATAEKLALAYYLDGRVSAVVGTHTHVQTADERILPNGTGYITDLGMCGGKNSILGVRKELAIERLRTHLPVRFENDRQDCVLNGVLLTIDQKTGKTTKIQRIVAG